MGSMCDWHCTERISESERRTDCIMLERNETGWACSNFSFHNSWFHARAKGDTLKCWGKLVWRHYLNALRFYSTVTKLLKCKVRTWRQGSHSYICPMTTAVLVHGFNMYKPRQVFSFSQPWSYSTILSQVHSEVSHRGSLLPGQWVQDLNFRKACEDRDVLAPSRTSWKVSRNWPQTLQEVIAQIIKHVGPVDDLSIAQTSPLSF